MEVKLLAVIMLLVQAALAQLEHVTVRQGQTLHLQCPIANGHRTSVEWRNPKAEIMFFNHNKVLRDKRYALDSLTESLFSISVSNINFKDGGNYTCSHYDHPTKEKTVKVTVIGYPKMSMLKQGEVRVIKCTAKGTHHPPQISWKINHGPEILGHATVHREDRTFASVDFLHVQSVKKRETVKCLVRHPALHSAPLLNFVKIGRDRSAGAQTTTGGPRHKITSAADVAGPPSQSSTPTPAGSSREPQTVSASSRSPVHPVTGSHLSTAGRTSVSETTEDIRPYTSTGRNTTGSKKDPQLQTASQGGLLLIFLVTCLIVALLIVVTFFAIKLRRAHVTWKRENEESDPSEESNKSKSSQEDKNSKGQRRRGLVNTAFTQYVVEAAAASSSNTESVNQERSFPPQPPSPFSADRDIKETEL